jgi:protein AroM
MRTIGFVTIAESPRDDVVPDIVASFPDSIQFVERGNLDGLTPEQIAALAPAPGESGIVARLESGGETLLSHHKILPRMQQLVDELVHDEQAELVIVLCGADWSSIRCSVPLINPGRVFPGVVSALAHGRRLGVIKPNAGQIEPERKRYENLGIEAIVTSASPYVGEERLTLARLAAQELCAANCDLIWMTCIGMDEPMREIVAEVTGKPVILARSILARVAAELVPARQPVLA